MSEHTIPPRVTIIDGDEGKTQYLIGTHRFRPVVRGRNADVHSIEVQSPYGWSELGGRFASAALAMTDAQDYAVHLDELETLPRVDVSHEWRGRHSPWGPVQQATRYAEGVVSVSTAGHGGFKLDAERNRAMPAELRIVGGYYEEDGDWAHVALGYPALFTHRQLAQAETSLRHGQPALWEAHYGRALEPGESNGRDHELHLCAHKLSLLVVSAIRVDEPAGMVKVHATMGGDRTLESQVFLVPDHEYAARKFEFVVDPARHAPWQDPDAGGPGPSQPRIY